MQSQWQRKRILMWGKTRPELSKKYREIVCCGGVFQDTRRLVRVYPVPLRFIDADHVFKKYQWIEADVMKASNDLRPESYKISADNITVLGEIPTRNGNWDDRAEWIMNPENIYQSVEALQDQQQKDRTSLGLVQPAEIVSFHAVPYSQKDRDTFWDEYKNALQQMELPLNADGHEVRPITPPDYQYKVRFRCNDERCTHVHDFSIKDWELDALYTGQRKRGKSRDEAADDVVKKLYRDLSPDHDVYFYLGNISNHQHIFMVGGLWYPKKKLADQLRMF
jgi:hypothetical protein